MGEDFPVLFLLYQSELQGAIRETEMMEGWKDRQGGRDRQTAGGQRLKLRHPHCLLVTTSRSKACYEPILQMRKQRQEVGIDWQVLSDAQDPVSRETRAWPE